MVDAHNEQKNDVKWMKISEELTQEDFELRPRRSTTSKRELVSIISARVKSTIACLVFYVFLLLLNMFVLLWELTTRVHKTSNGLVFILLESLISMMLIGEVVIGIFTLGWHEYFKSWYNILDFIVTILCSAFFVIYVVYEEAKHIEDQPLEIAETILMVLRYLFQFGRLGLIFRRARRSAKTIQGNQNVDIVDFGDDDPTNKHVRKHFIPNEPSMSHSDNRSNPPSVVAKHDDAHSVDTLIKI